MHWRAGGGGSGAGGAGTGGAGAGGVAFAGVLHAIGSFGAGGPLSALVASVQMSVTDILKTSNATI